MPPRGRAPPRRRAGHQAGPSAAATEPAGGRSPEWHARVTEQADTLCRTASGLLARRGAPLPRAELRPARAASVWLCNQVLDDTVDELSPGIHALGIHALLWLSPRRRVGLLALLAVTARTLASADVEGANFEDNVDLHFSLAKMLTWLLAAEVDSGQAAPEQQLQQRAALGEAATAAVAFAVGPMQLLHVYSRLLGATGPRRMPPRQRDMVVTTVCVLLRTLYIMFIRSRAAAPPAPSGGSSAAGAGMPGAAGQGPEDGGERAMGLLLSLSSSSVLEHAVRDTLVSSLEAGADRSSATAQVSRLLENTCDALAEATGRSDRARKVEVFEQLSCGRTAEAARAVLSGSCLQYAMAAHVVAQLAAADGGRVYGLPPAALLPPATQEGPGSSGSARVRPPRRVVVLRCGGLLASVRMWSWCLQLGVPLVAVSRGAVHEMALRLVTVVTASAAEEQARREQVGRAHKREQTARTAPSGGSGSSGHAAVSEPDAINSCPARASASGASGSDGAASAFVTAGSTARRGVAMPEADCPGLALDALRCASLSAHHPFVMYGVVRACRVEMVGAAAARKFWSAAAPALGTELEHAVAEGCWGSVQVVLQEMAVNAPDWPAYDAPNAVPPPNLAAALAAGYLPLLERSARAAMGVAPGRSAAPMLPLLGWWPRLGRLLSYGAPYEAVALLATITKVVRALLPPPITSSSSSSSVVMGDDPISATHLSNLMYLPLNHMMATMAAYGAAQRSVGWTLRTGAGAGAAYGAGPPSRPLRAGPPAGTEAADPPAGTKAAEAWCRGPSLQLLHLAHRALRLWLPAVAQTAAALLRPLSRPASDSAALPPLLRGASPVLAAAFQGIDAAYAVHAVLEWVPALLHAHARALTAQLPAAAASSGIAAAAAGEPERAASSSCAAAAVWRHLVLDEMDALGLIGAALAVLPEAPDAVGAGSARERRAWDHMGAALLSVRDALDGVAAAFPGEVAAALRQGRLPPRCLSLLSDPGLAAELAAHGRRVAAGPGGKRSASVPSIASRTLPDVTLAHGDFVSADELGAALLASADAPAGWPAEPPACSNPRCANLAGRSEAELPLLACSACGTARYCGPGCQRAHWARHKQACRARGGG